MKLNIKYKNFTIKRNLVLLFGLILTLMVSCTESSRQYRESRINYDSIASLIPKSDTLTFLNHELPDTNSELKYVISCNFPEMIHFDKENIQRKVNYILVSQAKDIINLFKLDLENLFSDTTGLNLPKDFEEYESRYSYLFINYNIVNNSRNLLSLIYDIEQYTAFAAHPISYHKTLNFDLNTGEIIDLYQYSLILDDSLFVNKISEKSYEKIKKYNISDSTWIRTGTLPFWENFKNFNIKSDSLIITFDVYQVAAYAVGPVRIAIGWDELVSSKLIEQ